MKAQQDHNAKHIFACGNKAEIVAYLDEFYAKLQANPVLLDGEHKKIISASSGFAMAGYEEEIETLLSHADEALYDLKRGTKGSYSEYKRPQT